MRYRNEIALEASDLRAGDRKYIKCPSCGRDKKLMVGRFEDGSVGFYCFRNSCSLHSGGRFYETGAGYAEVRAKRMKKTLERYGGDLEPLSPGWKKLLKEKIGWTEEHLRIGDPRVTVDTSRVAFPIFSPMGIRRGYVFRSYSGETPKALTHMEQEGPSTSFYRGPRHNNTLLLVEDIPSAVRAAVYGNSAALNGTGLSIECAEEIAAHFKHVVIALDYDATKQALKLQRKYSLLFSTTDVIMLDKDIKDMPEDEIKRLLEKL